MRALGLIETVGYATAVSAADAAVKAADVEIVGLERVIGVSGYVGVTIHLSGDVAAVTSAVEAGKKAAEKIGKIISAEVIARAHSNVNEELISKFMLNTKQEKEKQTETKSAGSKTKSSTTGKKSSTSTKTRSKKNDSNKDQ